MNAMLVILVVFVVAKFARDMVWQCFDFESID
jgi:hypothetical protein